MSPFKRFCYIVYFLLSIVGIGVLVVHWLAWPPLVGFVEAWIAQPWFLYAEGILLGIVALGLLIILCRALFSRGVRSSLEATNDYGSLYISRIALEKTVQRTVDSHPDLTFVDARVRIYNGREPNMTVNAEVIPHGITALDEYGTTLQAEIKEVVEKLTGKTVKRIAIDFREETPAAATAKKE